MRDYKAITDIVKKNERVLIYGTGKIAHELVAALENRDVIGVVDREKRGGEFDKLPIVLWEEIGPGSADILIIAAAIRNYKVIFDRVAQKCLVFGIKLFGYDGTDLLKGYSGRKISYEEAICLQRNADSIKKVIQGYDAVSFDVFDTLITRRVLEPIDVFRIIDKKLQEDGIIIPEYINKRKEAEYRSGNGNIRRIYELFGELNDISSDICGRILNIELETEKEVLTIRESMRDVFDYSKSLGIHVNLISDMYLPEDILSPILHELGIDGYENLFVSCDYATGKGRELFSEYKKRVKAEKYLHIGDNIEGDIEAPQKNGIDVFRVFKGLDLLRISNIADAEVYADSFGSKGLLGMMVSEQFNNPFSLFQTCGNIILDDLKDLSAVFFTPLVVYYLDRMIRVIKEQALGFDKVLFMARDCSVMEKAYAVLRKMDPSLPEGLYFQVSRKSLLRSGIISGEDAVIQLRAYVKRGGGDYLNRLYETDEIPLYQEDNNEDINDYLKNNSEVIIRRSAEYRQGLLKYMEKNGVVTSGKYLLCDLVSQGTCHYACNSIFDDPQHGFYLCKLYHGNVDIDDTLIHSIFCEAEDERPSWMYMTNYPLLNRRPFMERILCAVHGSVAKYDGDGNVVYSHDERSEDVLDLTQKIHNEIVEAVCAYFSYYGFNSLNNTDFLTCLLGHLDDEHLQGDCVTILKDGVHEDMRDVGIGILRNDGSKETFFESSVYHGK